jgi:hypothetical protein
VSDGEVSTGSIVKWALLGIGGPALATTFTWVDFEPVDVDLQWNGLGFVSGDEATNAADVGAAITPLGWIIVAAMAVGGLVLIASAYTRPLLLRCIAIAFGGIGLATSIICLAIPSLLLGNVLDAFGLSALDERTVLDTSYIWAEVVMTATFVFAVVYIEVDRLHPD